MRIAPGILRWVPVVIASSLQAAANQCPSTVDVVVPTNNPKFSGTCQIYRRGESPCISDDAALPEAVGWAVVVGFGAFFSLLTVLVSRYEYHSLGAEKSSEHFNTAGRNVGPGLTAAVIVSQWTWAATLLVSSDVGWSVGISGPFWYASGATVQILLFAVLAIQVKRRASHMHTFLEIVKARFGTRTHIIMVCFALTTNIIVTSMLLLGGASTIQDLTGMSKLTAAFLIPILSCWLYTMYGGLRATFFASYIHTSVIFIMLVFFTFTIYTGSGEHDLWGSPGNVYSGLEKASVHGFFEATLSEAEFTERRLVGRERELTETNSSIYFAGLQQLLGNDGTCYDRNRRSTGRSCSFVERGKDNPCCPFAVIDALDSGVYCRNNDADCISVSSAKHFESTDCDFAAGERCVTSFVTMGSTIGLIFGITNIVGNFGTVFIDQSYWQSAVAAKPKSAVIGFLIGGMVWFAVPFGMATTTGLAGRSLTTHPDINGLHGSRYITEEDSGNGLTPARVISQALGPFGAFILLLQLFMAITSTGSAEIIAVSSILTYDVYYEYVNPELKTRRESLRRLFYKTILEYVPPMWGADLDDDESEQAVRIQLSDVRFALDRVQDFLNDLAHQGFFAATPTEEEQQRLSSLLSAACYNGSLLVPDLYNAVNKAVSSNNIEGLVLLRVSMFFTGLFSLFMGFLAVLLLSLGMTLGQVYMSMGCIIGSAVGPASLTILMQTANKNAISAGCLGGLLIGLTAWMLRAHDEFGEVSYDTLMSEWPWVFGNSCAIIFGFLISWIGSLLWPDRKFRWSMVNERIALVDDVEPPKDPNEEREEKMEVQVKWAAISSLVLTVILLVLWPIPMHVWTGVLSEAGFTAWVSLEVIWAVVGGLVIIILPAVELARTFLQWDQAPTATLPARSFVIRVTTLKKEQQLRNRQRTEGGDA